MRISDWSSDVCSSDLLKARIVFGVPDQDDRYIPQDAGERRYALRTVKQRLHQASFREAVVTAYHGRCAISHLPEQRLLDAAHIVADKHERSEEHTSELQSLMRNSYAVFCLKNKTTNKKQKRP